MACEKGDVLEEDEVRGGENTNMCEDMPANQSPVLAVVVTKVCNNQHISAAACLLQTYISCCVFLCPCKLLRAGKYEHAFF